MNAPFKVLAIAAVTALMCPLASAHEHALPVRTSARPETTTNGVPHTQIGAQIDTELASLLMDRVAQFPCVTLGQTRISLPGAVGFQLERDMELSQLGSIVGGFEFAHTLAGIEVAHMIRKGQFDQSEQPDFAQFTGLAG